MHNNTGADSRSLSESDSLSSDGNQSWVTKSKPKVSRFSMKHPENKASGEQEFGTGVNDLLSDFIKQWIYIYSQCSPGSEMEGDGTGIGKLNARKGRKCNSQKVKTSIMARSVYQDFRRLHPTAGKAWYMK